MRRLCILLALIPAAAAAVGCAASGDKAGGIRADRGPTVLRMASTPYGLADVPPVAEFVHRVGALSGGTMRIEVISNWGYSAPGAEAQVVAAVAAGKVDLGWVGSRVFDTLGVPDFRALSAPMLISSYPQEDAVIRSGLASRMLAGLRKLGVLGLAVLGERLRLPFSRRPLHGPASWHGIQFGTVRSRVQEQAIRALGATPVVAWGALRAHDLAHGTIRGFELDIGRYVHDVGPVGRLYVTTNVALWPQFDVVLANPHSLTTLTAQQRRWLSQAAGEAAGDSVALAAGGNVAYFRKACAIGARFVTATPADLAAIRKALSGTYLNLESDPRTRAYIQQIRRLENATPHGPVPGIPAGCAVIK
jgi:TRAP-type C4-dicarboxylate transport system substrate-binding protein